MFGTMRKLHRSYLVAASLTLISMAIVACGGGGGDGNGGPPAVTVPNIVSTSPSDGTLQVPNDTEVVINFSEAMNPTSVVTGLDVASHSGTTTAVWQVGNARVDLSFDPILEEDTHYVVTLDAAVLDAEGTSLGSAYSFSFDTGSIPVATINSPAPFATNVSLDPIVSISFSEPMDTDSVQNSFNVTSYTGTLNFSWSGPGLASSLDVSFATSLASDTTYTATLLPFAEDDQGTALGIQSTVTFSTGTALATGAITGVIDDDPDSNLDNNLENTIMALWDHDFTNTEGPDPVLGTADASGAYHFSFLEDGSYWILAVQDTNGDGVFTNNKFAETGDSIGIWSDVISFSIDSVTVIGGGVQSSISFTLLDTEGISGDVTYAGANTAEAYASSSTVFVGAFSSMDLSGEPDYGVASSTDEEDDFDGDTNIWNYAINAFFESPGGQRMMTGSYYVGAFIDLDNDSSYDPDRNGDGDFDDGEPAGIFMSTVPILVTGQDGVGIDITTYDSIMLFGNVDTIADTTNLDGVSYQGATMSLLDYPLEAVSNSSGMFTMPFAPLGVNVAIHAEPQGGSSLLPFNSQYRDISSGDAYMPITAPSAEGIQPILLAEDVVSYFGTLCNVTVDPSKAIIGGNYNITDGEVLFASGTVKYVDSQFNCSHTSNVPSTEGPSFFIFIADATLFTDNKGDISGTFGGVINSTETIPVRNGEFTWVQLRD